MAKFVAEVSSNHHGDLARCKAFIDVSARIGCDAVKFQLFKTEELFAPAVLAVSEKHRERKAWELPLAFLPELAAHCQLRGIAFGCTPFYLDAVDELRSYVDFYKIASYELLWSELLVACAKTAKPVMISTGMAELSEVRAAVETLEQAGCVDLTVLHCVSGYPSPAAHCNLAAIDTLRAQCAYPVGWSDHSVDPAVVNRAVLRWGAEVVEFHLDLDTQGEEYGGGHCWLPDEIGAVIASLKAGALADGDGVKKPTAVEINDRPWRADPHDGLRPMRSIRDQWVAEKMKSQ